MGDRRQRVPQRIGDERVMTAHRDFADICPPCGGYIEKGQWYVRRGQGVYHYRCKPHIEAKPKPQASRSAKRKKRRERRAERKRAGEVINAQMKDRADSMNRFDYAINKGD